jgi:pyrroline-5-carboxylate reductase
MPGARAVRGWPVTAAQLLEGTFGLSLSKASAHQHSHDVEQLLESLALLSFVEGSKGSSQPWRIA